MLSFGPPNFFNYTLRCIYQFIRSTTSVDLLLLAMCHQGDARLLRSIKWMTNVFEKKNNCPRCPCPLSLYHLPQADSFPLPPKFPSFNLHFPKQDIVKLCRIFIKSLNTPATKKVATMNVARSSATYIRPRPVHHPAVINWRKKKASR